MRRPRFTLRWMMVAVAVVGLLLAGGLWARKLQRRSTYYSAMANINAQYEKDLLGMAAAQEARLAIDMQYVEDVKSRIRDDETLALLRRSPRNFEPEKARIRKLRKKAAVADERRRAYERAARYPWLSLPPDPPMPDSILKPVD